MGWQQEYCREWAPHCQTPLSVLLSSHSAALQCSSAHAQTDWERAPASLSSLEMLTARITDTTTLQSSVCTVGKKKSYSWQLNMNSSVAIWKVKTHRQEHVCYHKSWICDIFFTGLSFVSRSLCLPQAFFLNCSLQNEQSGCSFMASDCLCLVDIHHLPLQSLLQSFSWALYFTLYLYLHTLCVFAAYKITNLC